MTTIPAGATLFMMLHTVSGGRLQDMDPPHPCTPSSHYSLRASADAAASVALLVYDSRRLRCCGQSDGGLYQEATVLLEQWTTRLVGCASQPCSSLPLLRVSTTARAHADSFSTAALST